MVSRDIRGLYGASGFHQTKTISVSGVPEGFGKYQGFNGVQGSQERSRGSKGNFRGFQKGSGCLRDVLGNFSGSQEVSGVLKAFQRVPRKFQGVSRVLRNWVSQGDLGYLTGVPRGFQE